MADVVEIKTVVEDVRVAFEEFKKANDARLDEIEKKGSADPVIEEKLKKIEAELDAKNEILERHDLALKRADRGGDAHASGDIEAKAAEFGEAVASVQKKNTPIEVTAEQLVEYKGLFQKYMSGGKDVLGADELKQLSVGVGADGGFTVHPDFTGRIVELVYDTSPMREYASVRQIGTASIEGIRETSDIGSGWVAETAARAETGTPTIEKWSIPTHELYANPVSTQQLLDDSISDVEADLARKIAMKFSREESGAFVNGDGIGKPKGFLQYSGVGGFGVVNTGVDGDLTDPDILINVLYDIKRAYASNATWFMPRSVQSVVRRLKTSSGDYLWADGLKAAPPTLLGHDVATFDDMPVPAAGSLSIAFGDMRAAYQVVDRKGISMLRDPYTQKGFVSFYTTKRVGGDAIDMDALKLIKFSV